MTTAALVPVQPAFTDAERVALAGFLSGYRGLTREACALDLRQFAGWCRSRSLALFAVRRADIETFAMGPGSQRPRPGHCHPAAEQHRRVLPVTHRPAAAPPGGQPPGGAAPGCFTRED
jgi:hypothetical protein